MADTTPVSHFVLSSFLQVAFRINESMTVEFSASSLLVLLQLSIPNSPCIADLPLLCLDKWLMKILCIININHALFGQVKVKHPNQR